jgi:hypothetical protein
MLIPKEKLSLVKAALETEQKQPKAKQKKDLSEDPWQGLLEEDQ